MIKLVKTTILGGLIFLIPFFIVVVTVLKAREITAKLISPWAIKWGISSIAGKASLAIIVDILLLLICFLAGLIVASGRIRSKFPILEAMVGKMIPGYEILKAQSAGSGVNTGSDPWQAILLKDGEDWRIAFIVEKDIDGYSTVFIPGSIKLDEGEMKVMPADSMVFHPISARQAHRMIIRFGSGAAATLSNLAHPH